MFSLFMFIKKRFLRFVFVVKKESRWKNLHSLSFFKDGDEDKTRKIIIKLISMTKRIILLSLNKLN